MTDDHAIRQKMRADWDQRAREDARYYVAFGRRGQNQEEFLATAGEALHAIRIELGRFGSRQPASLEALEIGCGPGRLLLPLSRTFGRVVGVDVSPEMIERARRNLEEISNARAELNSGADLGEFPAESFDFCYSHAVFQHVPSRQVMLEYLREAWRVLRPGGVLKCQLNGAPDPPDRSPDTWSGVRFRAGELRAFCHAHDFQLLSLAGAETQNLWIVARKRPSGWAGGLRPVPGARLVGISNSWSADRVVPAAGRYASASLWVEGLTGDADLNNLEVEIAGRRQPPCYVGEQLDRGPVQVNVFLPAGTPTGPALTRLWMLGEPISNHARLRVIPPPPRVPRLLGASDGINLLSGPRIETRTVRLEAEEVGCASADALAGDLRIEIDGEELDALEICPVDPLAERYAASAKVPPRILAGPHQLGVHLRGRLLARLSVEIAE